ncbi:hypothetical protein C4J94_3051 [Pseudomonas sp. R5-89-07]|nr:hypothetical protein C4J94_3051 [Pseudomonas sp. R5-89-07]
MPGADARIYGLKSSATVALATADRQTRTVWDISVPTLQSVQHAWPGRFPGLARLLLSNWIHPCVRGTIQ